MEKRAKRKDIGTISIIGQADGPTSIFLAGRKTSGRTFKQRFHKLLYDRRKKQAIKSLKANPHSMDQVQDYITNELGFSQIDKTDQKYMSEYAQMRAAFILQYKPELLGALAEMPKLESHDEEHVKLFMAQMEQRQKAAEEISTDVFDIDLYMYEKNEEELQSEIIIEKKYDYIGGSACGSKKSMRRFRKMYKTIYQYYGVSQNDIDNQTKRYEELIKMLASR